MNRALLKTIEKLLYGSETAAVVFVIVVEEIGDFLSLIHHTPYIFLHIAPKFRAISCELDPDGSPCLVYMKNRIDLEEPALNKFHNGYKQLATGTQPVTVRVLAVLELVYLVAYALAVYRNMQLVKVTCQLSVQIWSTVCTWYDIDVWPACVFWILRDVIIVPYTELIHEDGYLESGLQYIADL